MIFIYTNVARNTNEIQLTNYTFCKQIYQLSNKHWKLTSWDL